MRAPYIEGVATHDDPESCAGARKGIGEALTGARMGRVSSREITDFRVPTLSEYAEGFMTDTDNARWRLTLRGRRPRARAESSCARTGSSPGRPPPMGRRDASGRPMANHR